MSTLVRKARIAPVFALLLCFSFASAQQPPAAAAPSAPGYVVVVPVANMYRGPSADTDVVSQAIYASNVSALEENGEWVHVRTADDYTGWTRAQDMAKLSGAAYAASGATVTVSAMLANVYREQDVTKHAPMVIVPFDARLAAEIPADPKARWIKVTLPDGRVGYIQNGDVAQASKKLTIPETIDLAKKFLGVTYTWGGTSSFGYDCSGFMQMLMKQRGYLMPRDANIQASWTGVAPVERKDLQPGDLLYFGSSAEHITHTGMYIGDGKFINDTTHIRPAVQIDDLNDPYWTKLLVAQRRVK
jgi:gamma-D-glutamyl-L-lysine dipeptidyl-peptidase